MKTLTVELPGREYDIIIGDGLLSEAGERLSALFPPGKAAVITDRNVRSLYGVALEAGLRGFEPFFITLPVGERTKSLGTLEMICTELHSNGLRRNDPVLAFGGGVVGDAAGLAAATYMRGVPFVQIPTTLLAQADSAVGGKVAVNLPSGKNLIGAFYQPRLVLADTAALRTLTERDFASGMAEVVKHAAIQDPELLRAIEDAGGRGGLNMPATVERNCAVKSGVVIEDERERGRRRILNFGHTFGHAVETLGGYDRYTHGEAVAIGMVLAARAGERLGVSPAGMHERLAAVLRSYGLPSECEYTIQELIPYMLGDKKNTSGAVTLVLLRDFGQPVIRECRPEELYG